MRGISRYIPNRPHCFFRWNVLDGGPDGTLDASRYRYEIKYLIDTCQIEELLVRLRAIMRADDHAGPNGSYRVRSLYFDDWDNSAYFDNVEGNDPRSKFRLRLYNDGPDVRLEYKEKRAGLTAKQTCLLTEEQADMILQGRRLWLEQSEEPLWKRFCLARELNGLSAKIIVQYDRTPFVYPDGNVRVTLDRNISASAQTERFLSTELLTRPVMPVGLHLLEVKYTQWLPDHIFRTLQMDGLKRVSYSKYCLCRRIGGTI